jgi:hypothetical protein
MHVLSLFFFAAVLHNDFFPRGGSKARKTNIAQSPEHLIFIFHHDDSKKNS